MHAFTRCAWGWYGVELEPGCEGRLTFSSDAEIEEPLGGTSYEIATWVEIEGRERKKQRGTRSYLRQRQSRV